MNQAFLWMSKVQIRTGYLAKEIKIKRGDLIDLIFFAQPDPPHKDGVEN